MTCIIVANSGSIDALHIGLCMWVNISKLKTQEQHMLVAE